MKKISVIFFFNLAVLKYFSNIQKIGNNVIDNKLSEI